ncbi:MAG: HD domain-containing protein [Dehalococcoidia bacterium]
MTKLTKEMPRILVPEEAASLLAKLRELLQQRSISCYVVGGFVRDGLLGRANSDIDIVVSGDALGIASDAAAELGARVVPLDELNQVARVVFPGAGYHWHLDFASLRGSIEEDLANRDFTVNAIAIDLAEIQGNWSEVQVVDPLGGHADLGHRIVRATGEDRFQQDPARLLRAVRLAATLDFIIDQDTESLIERDCKLITTVSAERVRDELCLILETPRAYDSFRHMDRLGLLEPIMPELAPTRGVAQPKEHFWDVFDHSLETVAAVERLLRQQGSEQEDEFLASVPWSPEIAEHFAQEIAGSRTRRALLKLAGLLHDIAKPSTKTTEKDGRMRFLGHAAEGAAMATQLMERLRFSNREGRTVQLMIEQHLRPGYLVGDEMPSRRAIYRYLRDTAEVSIDTLFLSLADHLAARGPTLDLIEWRKHTEMTHYILFKWFQEQATVVPPKLIDGHALIERFGLAPGPQIGALLEMVREAQAAGEVSTMEEALNLVAKRLRRN